MTKFLEYLNPYMLLIKILAGIALIASIYFAWQHYIAKPYINEGKAQVQALWDKQKAQSDILKAQDIAQARLEEKKRATAAKLIDEQLIKGLQDEKTTLSTSVTYYRNQSNRMRVITGKALPESGTGNIAGGVNITDATCRAELPAEIGLAFERLREDVIRIGSEANETAIKANKLQKQVKQDRVH